MLGWSFKNTGGADSSDGFWGQDILNGPVLTQEEQIAQDFFNENNPSISNKGPQTERNDSLEQLSVKICSEKGSYIQNLENICQAFGKNEAAGCIENCTTEHSKSECEEKTEEIQVVSYQMEDEKVFTSLAHRYAINQLTSDFCGI